MMLLSFNFASKVFLHFLWPTCLTACNDSKMATQFHLQVLVPVFLEGLGNPERTDPFRCTAASNIHHLHLFTKEEGSHSRSPSCKSDASTEASESEDCQARWQGWMGTRTGRRMGNEKEDAYG